MYNVHGMYLTEAEKGALLAHLKRLKPGFVVVMDDPGFAVRLRRELPNTAVCYRKYFPSDNGGDDHAHTKVTPQQWLNVYASEIPPSEGVFFYAGNEAGFSPELVTWLTEVARLTLNAGGRAALGNWSVGTPEPNDWRQARELLKLCGDNPTKLLIALHEYFPTSVSREFGLGTNPASWPDKVIGTSWFVGRYRHLFAACDAMGIKRPRVAFTEKGSDRIHAVGEWQQGLPRPDDCEIVGPLWCSVEAWQRMMPAGYTWPRYLVDQMAWEWRAIYRHDPEVVGMAYFCWGAMGGSAWEGFDLRRVPNIMQLVEAKEWQRMNTTPQPQPAHWIKEITWNTGMKFRAAPSLSAPQITVIQAGVTVQAIGNVKVAEGYAWIPVTFNGVPGWSALGAV